jgi:hypothetical protein
MMPKTKRIQIPCRKNAFLANCNQLFCKVSFAALEERKNAMALTKAATRASITKKCPN